MQQIRYRSIEFDPIVQKLMLLKADRSHLTRTVITNKLGRKQTVFVNLNKLLNAIEGFFGVAASKKPIEKLAEEERVKHKIQYPAKDWASHFQLYWSQKDKWDKKFSREGGQVVRKKANRQDQSVKQLAWREKFAYEKKRTSSINLKIMKTLYDLYGRKTNVEQMGKEFTESKKLERGRDGTGDERTADVGGGTRGMGERYGESGIVLARENRTQFPKEDHISQDIAGSLMPHQRDFVNLAIEKFDAGESGILNMDGTGTGKTRQQLALADTWMKRGNGPILMLTMSKTIINDAFKKDADAMGVEIVEWNPGEQLDKNKIYIGTYNGLSKDKPRVGLTIFDESHAMKNYTSARTKNGIELMQRAGKTAVFSATTVDKPDHMKYVCQTLGLNFGRTMGLLGYEWANKYVGGRQGYIKQLRRKRGVSAEEAVDRLDALFEDITKKGLAVKREVPMKNMSLSAANVKLNNSQIKELNELEKTYKKAGNPGIAKMQTRRLLERMKIPATVDEIKRGLSQGKRMIVFAGSVNDSEFKGAEEVVEGTLKQLSVLLDEAGIKHSKVFGGASTVKQQKARASEIAKFQNGESEVLIGTPESGGVGVSMDDTVGDAPRRMIIMSPPFSAVDFAQQVGRISRLNTKSPSEVVMMLSDTSTDAWNVAISSAKARILGAAVSGDYKKLDAGDLQRVMYMDEDEREQYLSGKDVRESVPKASPISIDMNQLKSESLKPQASTIDTSMDSQIVGRKKPATATFSKLRNGEWGLRITGDVKSGDRITVTKKSGEKKTVTVGRVLWSGDGVHLASVG